MKANELRELVETKNKPKQDKYMIKLRKKIDKRAKWGYNTYIIQTCYMPKWFDFEFKCRIKRELQKDDFAVVLESCRILIGW